MDSSQTATDYKSYFHDKFVDLFKTFVKTCHERVTNEETKKDLSKIISLFDKLNYEKIITKIAGNTKLQESLLYLLKNDFSEEVLNKLITKDDKSWTVMPSLYIDKIFYSLNSFEDKNEIYKQLYSLHICGFTYTKVIDSINNGDPNSFNPFVSVGKVSENMDIKTLFEGVETKNISAFEMIMENFVSQQMDSKMANYMNNIKEDDVNSAASKLNEALNSEKFKSSSQTTEVLCDMLGQIKSEVISIGKTGDDQSKGKKGVEQILGIAQKVASNMMGKIKEQKIDVMDLWNTTSNLAQSTTNSDALKYVDTLIRSNIQKTLTKNQEQQQAPSDAVVENPQKSKEDERRERKLRKERKERRDKAQ